MTGRLVRLDDPTLPFWRRPIRVDAAALSAALRGMGDTLAWRRVIDHGVIAVAGISIGWALWAFAAPVGPVGDWRAGGAATVPPAARADLLSTLDPFFRNQPVVTAAADAVSALPLTLFGTRINAAGAGGSAIIAGADGVQHSVRVGDAVSDGVRLVEVTFDYVVLERQGRRERLYLDPAKAPKTTTPGAPATAADAVAAASTGAGGVAVAALGLTPRIRDGVATGLAVRPGGDGAALAAFGLRPGDVVRSVNGTPVSSTEALAGMARPGARLTLSVERGAEVVPVAVDVPGAAPAIPVAPAPVAPAR